MNYNMLVKKSCNLFSDYNVKLKRKKIIDKLFVFFKCDPGNGDLLDYDVCWNLIMLIN